MKTKAPTPKVTDEKKKYIFRFDFIGLDIREWLTKPMTSLEFEDVFENSYILGEFPILLEGNRKEIAGENKDEWDRISITEAMGSNPNLLMSWGIYEVS